LDLLRLVRARCFVSSVVTPRGYKSIWPPTRTPSSSHMNSHCLLASFMCLKGEREENIERDTGEISGAYRVLLLLPSHLMVDQGLTLSEVT
jgi:hypothetical protein